MRHPSSVGVVLAAAALLALGATVTPAAAATGILRCNVRAGFGALVIGSRAITCTYRRLNRPTEFYTGSVNSIGLDFGPTNARTVIYSVTAEPDADANLQGDFGGPSIGLAAGAGETVNVLVGPHGFSLVPLPNTAATAFTGLNVSANVNRLHLEFAGVEQAEEGRRGRRRNDYVPY